MKTYVHFNKYLEHNLLNIYQGKKCFRQKLHRELNHTLCIYFWISLCSNPHSHTQRWSLDYPCVFSCSLEQIIESILCNNYDTHMICCTQSQAENWLHPKGWDIISNVYQDSWIKVYNYRTLMIIAFMWSKTDFMLRRKMCQYGNEYILCIKVYF
jgi:hypothetical protein